MRNLDTIDFLADEATEIALKVKDRYVCCQLCDDGYDYTIYTEDYILLDGGIYDNQELTMPQVVREILADILLDDFLRGCVEEESQLLKVDYDTIMEQSLLVEQKNLQNRILLDYKNSVERNFHPICQMGVVQVITLARDYLQEKIESYDLDARIVDMIITGSRSKGLEREDSDLDFAVGYEGRVREDFLFNIAHEDEYYIGNVPVDINPINVEEKGSMADYIKVQEKYFLAKE